MAPGAQVDYDALAQQSGGTPAVNYDQLASQYGGAPAQPPQAPEDIPSPHESMLSTIGNTIANFGQSEVSEAAKSLGTIDKAVSKMPYVGRALTTPLVGGATSEQAQSDLAQVANEPGQGAGGAAGGFMENALEFIMGDAAFKGLTYASKIKQAAPILSAIEKSPKLAAAVESAMRTGAVSAGQAAVKGGDTRDVVTQGLVGAGVGAATEGIAGKLKSTIAERSPQVTNVAGEQVITPRPAQVPPEVQAAQTAGKNVIAKSAQGATARSLPESFSDETRPLNNQGSARGPAVITKPPIVDVPAAISKVQSFGDAADTVEDSAKKAYANLNTATNGQFEVIRDQVKQAGKDVWNAGSPAERDAAQIRLDNANNQMQQLFEEAGGRVTPQDWKDANSAFTAAKTLRQVHNAVESTFDTDAGFSQRSGTYRGFNGNQLRQNLNRLTQKIGEPELNRVVGRDNMDNLRKIAELTRTNADRAKFGAAVQQVGHYLVRAGGGAAGGALLGHFTPVGGFGGAVVGEAAAMAMRKVMQAVATNPRVGQQLTFAVESGARPEYYAPLIGKLIRDAEEEGKAK